MTASGVQESTKKLTKYKIQIWKFRKTFVIFNMIFNTQINITILKNIKN